MAVVRKGQEPNEQMELDAPNPRAVIGGNEPQLEERIAAEFREAMLTEKPEIYGKLDDLLGIPAVIDRETGEEIKPAVPGSVQRAKCENDEDMANCGKLVNALRQAGGIAEKAKKAVKDPYWLAGKAVDAEYNAIIARIAGGSLAVEQLQKAYARKKAADEAAAEEKRQAELREAEERRQKLADLAKEAGLEDALPPPPEPNEPGFHEGPPRKAEPIRTDGATVSTGKEWVIDSVDVVKAIKFVKANTKVREAVTAAIKALVKSTENNAGKGYAGVTARQDVKISNR